MTVALSPKTEGLLLWGLFVAWSSSMNQQFVYFCEHERPADTVPADSMT